MKTIIRTPANDGVTVTTKGLKTPIPSAAEQLQRRRDLVEEQYAAAFRALLALEATELELAQQAGQEPRTLEAALAFYREQYAAGR